MDELELGFEELDPSTFNEQQYLEGYRRAYHKAHGVWPDAKAKCFYVLSGHSVIVMVGTVPPTGTLLAKPPTWKHKHTLLGQTWARREWIKPSLHMLDEKPVFADDES